MDISGKLRLIEKQGDLILMVIERMNKKIDIIVGYLEAKMVVERMYGICKYCGKPATMSYAGISLCDEHFDIENEKRRNETQSKM